MNLPKTLRGSILSFKGCIQPRVGEEFVVTSKAFNEGVPHGGTSVVRGSTPFAAAGGEDRIGRALAPRFDYLEFQTEIK